MKANEVLKVGGYGKEYAVRWPGKVVGSDEGGLIVEWQYKDCTLVMKRWNGQYRVAEIREAQS
jgi:hypothetical protein